MNLQFDTTKLSIRDLIELRKLEYSRFKPVKCPLLGDELVYFNNEGFFHLTHNGQKKIRKESDQRMRLNLIPKASLVIGKSSCFGAPVRTINDSGTNRKITYYELTYRVNTNKKISVVLRRIGEKGRLQYYSIRYNKRHNKK